MANTILTPTMVAREALMILRNRLVATQVVYRDYEAEWGGNLKVGDTVKIRKPASFEAKEFDGGTGIEIQNIDEGSLDLTVEKHFDVSLEVTSKEWTLDLDAFSERVIYPAMVGMAQKIDTFVLGKYTGCGFLQGTISNGDPDALADIAQLRKALETQMVPQDMRRYLINPSTDANYLVLDPIVHAEKSGSTQALREANLGRLMGFDIYMTQNMPQHTPGAYADLTDVTVDAVYAKGATTISLASTAGSSTAKLEAGDQVAIAGHTTKYAVVSQTAAAVAGDIASVVISPGLEAATVGTEAVTFGTKNSGTAFNQNLAFHRNALAAVLVPLEMPKGAANAQIMNFEGIGVRVVYDYDSKYKKDVISFDILVGAKVIQPELMCRQIGAVEAVA